MVYVLNKNGDPLMPTERCGKIKAILVRRSPFTIKPTYQIDNYKQNITLGVDAGTETKEPFVAEISIRTRRNHFRYHEPRFLNRIKFKNQKCFIKRRYTFGNFALRALSGRVVHNSAKYTDLRLIQKINTFIFERRIGVSYPTYAVV